MKTQLRSAVAKALLMGFPLLFSLSDSHAATTSTTAGVASGVAPPAGLITGGQRVFRFSTFGNEGFWTDALRLPQGLIAAGTTPMDALKLGLNVDIEALDSATVTTLKHQLALDPTGKTSALLNDPKTMIAWFNASAIVGLPAKDSNHNGVVDITHGDKIGMSCALCHSIASRSIFSLPTGGAIGYREDGRASHTLDFGTLIARGTNTRAYYPVLQLKLGGKTLGRAPTGITPDSTEAEVDAYLTNKAYYPVGMFDDTADGNGAPMHNMPVFRQDLAAPFGSAGEISKGVNFANIVYTSLLDPTDVLTPGGRKFLKKLRGNADGEEMIAGYTKILADTGVTGYPFEHTHPPANPAAAGTEQFPLGIRVNNESLQSMQDYLNSLPAPEGVDTHPDAIARGRMLFVSDGCASCHNVNQAQPLRNHVFRMKRIWPGDNPVILLAARKPPLNPIENTVDNIFDDKMAVVNASMRGLPRGIALPLLLDLARKPVFLHDNSVPSLDNLLDPARGPTAPHAFFVSGVGQCSDVVEFLNSLDTR